MQKNDIIQEYFGGVGLHFEIFKMKNLAEKGMGNEKVATEAIPVRPAKNSSAFFKVLGQ